MKTQLLGIHHITAIAGDPQNNLDFYAGVLGLRLVKKTINFDDPYTYHFYFGNGEGNPGSIMTFFPWTAEAHRGRRGSGQITSYAFSIPPDSGRYWRDRLKRFGLEITETRRFGDPMLAVADPDGFTVELIESSANGLIAWNRSDVPEQSAIQCLHSVTITHRDERPTTAFMVDEMGFVPVQSAENRFRYSLGNGLAGSIVDVVADRTVNPGTMGAGIVHHVAFRTPDDDAQIKIRETLLRNGRGVSPVMDRQYFHSVYFNEPGRVLFEIATDPPGFMTDENRESLGTELKLPPWHEPLRRSIEQALPVIVPPEVRAETAQQQSRVDQHIPLAPRNSR
jgi:glyoxalase family protein